MKLRLWQVDAFAERAFSGNPAAVVPLSAWLSDATMQAIANENNLSETAFFVAREPGVYDLRWFTPTVEVDLCGHATLASGWVILGELAPSLTEVEFRTRSGPLTVGRAEGGRYRMSLPSDPTEPFSSPSGFAGALGNALGVEAPAEIRIGRNLMAVWAHDGPVRAIRARDLAPLLHEAGVWGLIATGKGDGKPYDCVSRFFAPGKGVPEDPVTGSAHCAVAPYWAKRLGKRQLRAYQASQRGGDLLCTDEGERVAISGACVLYMRGEIEV